VLTIWPSHLLFDLAPRTGSRLKRKHDPSPIFTAAAPADLLSTASTLFDYLGTLKAPESEEPAAEESEVGDDLGPIELTPECQVNGVASPRSDIDDLFSDQGDSLQPLEPEFIRDGDELSGVPPDIDELFDEEEAPVSVLEDDTRMDGGEAKEYEVDEGRGLDERQEENMFITEDDFAFFDTPAGSPDGAQRPESPKRKIQSEVPPAVTSLQQESGHGQQPGVGEEQPRNEVEEAIRAKEGDEPQARSDNVHRPSGDASNGSTDNLPPTSASPQARLIKLYRQSSPSPLSPKLDVIPSRFEPLSLSHNSSTLPSLAFTFPSPAPTQNPSAETSSTALGPPKRRGTTTPRRGRPMKVSRSGMRRKSLPAPRLRQSRMTIMMCRGAPHRWRNRTSREMGKRSSLRARGV
jgi:hypothetical protein